MEAAPAIIVFNGCFCPVHAGHVKALEDTKRKLEADGTIRIVAGYFAVAPDHYVKKKIQGKLEPWMTAAARVDMCKAVSQDVGWAVSADECESWKRCGAAMIAKNHETSTKMFGVRDEAKKGGVSRKGDGETAELSSTSIRAEFGKRGCTHVVIDDLVDQGVLGRAVGQCLKHKLAGSTVCTVSDLADEVPAWPTDASSIYEINRLSWVDTSVHKCAPYREIRAIHDEETVRVYQAYNDAIADLAVSANSFQAPLAAGKWSSTRMTWIKPSAVWMAYRCGWTVMKDRNQGRVLALDLSRAGFERLLMQAALSHDRDNKGVSLKDKPVVVQWDPERVMDPNAKADRQALTRDVQRMRSIQVGLRGSSVQMLLDPEFVLRITDVTPVFIEAHRHLAATPPDVDAAVAALWSEGREEQMHVPLELRVVLKMDESLG